MDFRHIKIFKDKTKLAEAFCKELLLLSRNRDEFFLALSGGSTPKVILQFLAGHYHSKINWEKIHLFWGDERCVPPDNSDSNYGMTKRYLLDYIDIPGKNIHRIKGENIPETEALEYSEEINNYVPIKNGLPAFDILMLGIGEDGHTASIFPDQMHLLTSEKICEVAIQPDSGQKRITLSGKVINNSVRVIFLVTGKKKASILKEVLVEKKKIYPAEFIKTVNDSLRFFIDSEASVLLRKE